jgi:hypothetical protein
MIAYVVYVPLAVATAVLLFYSARGALRGYGNGRLVPLALGLGAALSASLVLMFAVDAEWARWVAVGLVAASAGPLLAPVVLILVAVFVSWLRGKPIRWN